MKISKLLAAILLIFALSPNASASIVSAVGLDGGNGVIGVTPPPAGTFDLDVIKVYTDVGAMAVAVSIDSEGFYFFHETIANLTPDPWESFTWLLSSDPGVFFFDVGILGGPFTVPDPIAPAATTIATVSSGPLLPGEVFTVDLTIIVTQPSITSFALIQIPTAGALPTPEPGTIALLGIALVGLGLSRRLRSS